jgi:phosphoglycerate dehydrogenase-like enzyme
VSAAVARVLMSAAARHDLAQALAALQATTGGFEPVTLDAARADPTLQVDAAFISRDITGPSTKTQLTDDVLAAYAVLRRSPQLRWVHSHSAGTDRPIYGELRARGVAVTTSAGANAMVVAQTALGGVLALARRLPQLMQAQRERRWAPLIAGPAPPDLAGQTAVLVGWGPIARTLQPWLTMLGMKVVVVRRSDAAAAPGVPTLRFDAFATALPQADWLILACPLNPQTQRLVDAAALACLKPGAMLVNVARGEVVDEAALVAALQSGRVGGACLDVFELEPLSPASPLWRLPQVIVLPHSAGHAAGNAARVAAIFLDNLERWLQGRPLVNAAE